jgi:hypothetical protein
LLFAQGFFDPALGNEKEQAGRDAFGGMVAGWCLAAARFQDRLQRCAHKSGMLCRQDFGKPSGLSSDAFDHPTILPERSRNPA